APHARDFFGGHAQDRADVLGSRLLAHRDLVDLEVPGLDVRRPDGPSVAPLIAGQPLDAASAQRTEGPDEDTGALPGFGDALVPQDAERLPGRHTGHAVRGHEVVLPGKPITGTVLARLDRLSQRVRDPLVLGPTVVGSRHSLTPPRFSRHLRP